MSADVHERVRKLSATFKNHGHVSPEYADWLLSIGGCAEITDESPATWRRRVLLKQITTVKLGANVRIRYSDLMAFIANRVQEAA